MKNYSAFLAIFISVLSINGGSSSVRVDLSDRTPQQVVAKSYQLGETLEPGCVTGAVVIDNNELATGIALDPDTVLTGAHSKFYENNSDIFFVLDSNVQSSKKYYVSKYIIHPGFRWESNSENPSCLIYFNEKNGSFMFDLNGYKISLNDTQNLNFAGFEKAGFSKHNPFTGVDIAILKLKNSLPEGLSYPKILSPNFDVSNTYGISLGFGDMKYNYPDGTKPVTTHPQEKNMRHVISTKVSSYELSDARILYGNYRTLAVNSDECFITDSSMMKTEGIPVGGDSGGPLFIKIDENNKYMLCGIFSKTFSLHNMMSSLPLDFKEILKQQQYTQPVFPTWIDVRHYKDWILQNMGNGKV